MRHTYHWYAALIPLVYLQKKTKPFSHNLELLPQQIPHPHNLFHLPSLHSLPLHCLFHSLPYYYLLHSHPYYPLLYCLPHFSILFLFFLIFFFLNKLSTTFTFLLLLVYVFEIEHGEHLCGVLMSCTYYLLGYYWSLISLMMALSTPYYH